MREFVEYYLGIPLEVLSMDFSINMSAGIFTVILPGIPPKITPGIPPEMEPGIPTASYPGNSSKIPSSINPGNLSKISTGISPETPPGILPKKSPPVMRSGISRRIAPEKKTLYGLL